MFKILRLLGSHSRRKLNRYLEQEICNIFCDLREILFRKSLQQFSYTAEGELEGPSRSIPLPDRVSSDYSGPFHRLRLTELELNEWNIIQSSITTQTISCFLYTIDFLAYWYVPKIQLHIHKFTSNSYKINSVSHM